MIITNIIQKKLISKIQNSPTIAIGDFLVLNDDEQLLLNNYNTKLKNGYPLDYLIGYVEYDDYRIFVEEGVFIPRPCTEELIDLVNLNGAKTVVDVCSGSGLIGLLIASHNPSIEVTTIEQSLIAINCIKQSIAFNNTNNINVVHADALLYDYSQFNDYIIICNPPYVPHTQIYDSVKYEPKDAIYSGLDGLTFFNKFITMISTNLPNQIYLELDPSNILQASHTLNQYYFTKIVKDKEGFSRFLIGTKKE